MKKLFLTIAVMLLLGVSVRSQDVCPQGKVCIDQSTANKLFNVAEQLIEAKTAIEKLLKERGASEAAINSALQVIEGWKQLDVINNIIIAKQKDVIALYEKTLNLYASLVEKLEARLMKPQSAWSKFLSALKTVLSVAAGIALGRGF